MADNNRMEICRQRSALYRELRSFFDKKGYLEVETPVLTPALVPEHTIEVFKTSFNNEFTGNRNFYLIPSPEVHIKKLLSCGFPSLYEISKCFRNSEQIGKIHNPEFTMLEYYTVGFDENDSLDLTTELLRTIGIKYPRTVLSVRDAVLQSCKIDIDSLQDRDALAESAVKLGLSASFDESWDDVFNRIFCTFVETSLPQNTLVYLTDYPKQIYCLAKKNGNYRHRWELYINGVELANCFYEENDSDEINNYYEVEIQNMKENKVADDELKDLMTKLPKCSGVAMGLDRLLMIKCGLESVKDVLLFCYN